MRTPARAPTGNQRPPDRMLQPTPMAPASRGVRCNGTQSATAATVSRRVAASSDGACLARRKELARSAGNRSGRVAVGTNGACLARRSVTRRRPTSTDALLRSSRLRHSGTTRTTDTTTGRRLEPKKENPTEAPVTASGNTRRISRLALFPAGLISRFACTSSSMDLQKDCISIATGLAQVRLIWCTRVYRRPSLTYSNAAVRSAGLLLLLRPPFLFFSE